MTAAIVFTLSKFKWNMLADADSLVSFSLNKASGSETTGSIDVEVVLAQPATQELSVNVTTSGTAYSINEGTGQDFRLSSNKLTFAPNETRKILKLTVNNDNINETDETIDLYLTNPNNTNVGTSDRFTYTILDDDRKFLADVTKYGAKGDGVIDDSAALNRAISDTDSKGGGVVYFPPGTYKAFNVKMEEGITYEGYGATIKRPDLAFFKERISPNKGDTYEHVVDISGVRMFGNYDWYSGDTDSAPLVIRGLSFDGSNKSYKNWLVDKKWDPETGKYIIPYTADYQRYDFEQASDIIVAGAGPGEAPATGRPGRVKLFAEDLSFVNGVSDGLHVVNDVDATVYNLRATNTFRGGFVTTGGHTIAKVKKLTTSGDTDITGIDVETDSWGWDGIVRPKGTRDNGTLKSEVTMEDINLIDGRFNVNMSQGSTYIGKNIFSNSPMGLSSPNSHIYISDSKFYNDLGKGMSEMRWPTDVKFENTQFIANRNKVTGKDLQLRAAPFIVWDSTYLSIGKQNVVFKNCTFDKAADVPAGDKVYGILTAMDNAKNENTLTVDGGSFSDKLDVGVGTSYGGGTWVMKNLVNNAKQPFQWNDYVDPWFHSLTNLSIDGIAVNSSNYMYIDRAISENTLTQNDVFVDQANSLISTHDGFSSSLAGNRTILGDGQPTNTTTCFKGDIYRLKSIIPGATSEWDCTSTGYLRSNNSYMNSTWQARPTLSTVASLKNIPLGSSSTVSPSFDVNGANITAYKYRIDGTDFGSEISVGTALKLTNLSLGKHKLEIIGKNNSGQWQDQTKPTSYVWIVTDPDTLPPVVLVSGNQTTTISSQITLAIGGFDQNTITQMKISNFPNFDNAAAESYAESKAWTLLPNKGIKTVYVWLKDIKNNWTPANAPYVYTVMSLENDIASPPPTVTPSTPTGLKATIVAGKVELSWVASTGTVSGYNIFRTEKGIERKISTSSTTNFTDTNVTPNIEYTYTVSAYNPVDESNKSTGVTATITTGGTAPAPPTGLKARAVVDRIVLSWIAPSGTVSGYNIYRTIKGVEQQIATSTIVSFTDTNVVTNVPIYYKVSAYNSYGVSVKTNVVSATLARIIDTFTVTITGPTEGQIFSALYRYLYKIPITPSIKSQYPTTKVEYFIDGNLVKTIENSTSYNYSHKFSLRGDHKIQVKAYNSSPKSVLSSVRTITIK